MTAAIRPTLDFSAGPPAGWPYCGVPYWGWPYPGCPYWGANCWVGWPNPGCPYVGWPLTRRPLLGCWP